AAGQGNLQAAARAARYRLMSEWCRAKGVLHLLTAHHLDDQAETFLLRLGRGSGLYGLACMAGVSEHHDVRLLRPVLGVPRENLTAYLVRAGQDWVEDPSNADPAFARVRMRAALPGLAEGGITAARIGATTARLARDRVSLEREVARRLAATVRPDPAGFVHLDLPRFLIAPDGIALRALSRLLAAVGGLDYGPRFERLERLYAELKVDARPRTLGGCIVMPSRPQGLLICREAAAQTPPIEISAPGTLIWDDRFHVRIRAVKGGAPGAPMTLGPLGRDGWAWIKPDKDGFAAGQGRPVRVLPAVVRSGLPALSDARGVLEVPHLGYRRCVAPIGSLSIAEIWPMPPQPMAAAGFGVIGGRDR
ncbi:MAG TPA: tRNA lysidine(34) synthetase TilS, partial [Alphaproteobacteria bacterium]|nr:tRNA lysidine(34) synthetase TilS [Alphaproteobacteria bacterium]